jgi:pimeloyl-ACP methyl ester carboxylesterase
MSTPGSIVAGYADCRFGQIHYRARGATPLMPLLILNPRSRSCLRLIPLLEKQRPIFIVDIPAYGSSSAPQSACTMKDVAEAVISLMDASGLSRVHVFGLHTGAKVAAALASNWPNRVQSLVIGGKSHSLVPDRERRNKAMRDQVAKRPPDVVLVGLESYSADDAQAAGRAIVYEANFAFDFAGELERTRCPVLVIEIASQEEDAQHGRQGGQLAAFAARGSSVALAERESMGVDLYAGAQAIALALKEFMTREEAAAR